MSETDIDNPAYWLTRAAGALDCAVQLTGDENTAEIIAMETRLDELAGEYRFAGIHYDGPDESVECSYPGCTNRLRRSACPGPQFCSKEHRDAAAALLRCQLPTAYTATVLRTGRWPLAWGFLVCNEQGKMVYGEGVST